MAAQAEEYLKGRLRLADLDDWIAVDISASIDRLRIEAGGGLIGDWPRSEIQIEQSGDGFRVSVEGETLELDPEDRQQLARALGLQTGHVHPADAGPPEPVVVRTPPTGRASLPRVTASVKPSGTARKWAWLLIGIVSVCVYGALSQDEPPSSQAQPVSPTRATSLDYSAWANDSFLVMIEAQSLFGDLSDAANSLDIVALQELCIEGARSVRRWRTQTSGGPPAAMADLNEAWDHYEAAFDLCSLPTIENLEASTVLLTRGADALSRARAEVERLTD